MATVFCIHHFGVLTIWMTNLIILLAHTLTLLQSVYLSYYRGRNLGETVRAMIDALLLKEMRKRFNIIGTYGEKYAFKEYLLVPVQMAAMQLHPGATYEDVKRKVRNYLKNTQDSESRRVSRAHEKQARDELLHDAGCHDDSD